MSIFGFSSKKEVEEKERQAKEALLKEQQTDLGNLAKGSQVPIAVPFFDVFDPRFENFAVPVAVHGTLVYAVDDIARFNSLNKTQNINDGVFQEKLKGQVNKYIKAVVTNAPADNQIQVTQIERKILEIVDELPDARHDGKAAVVGDMAEKHVEPRDLVAHTVFKIAVCHGQLVKVRQHGQIPFLQCVAQGDHSSL